MPVLLVVDDEPAILHAFRRVFREPEVTLWTASNPAEGIEVVGQQRPDVIILDVEMPGMSGLDAFRRIREIDARVPIIFITGHAGTEEAIEAVKLGAFDYLFKPVELAEVRELVAGAFRISRMMRVPATIADDLPADVPGDVLLGRSPGMKEVYVAIGRVAPQDATVLIQGESGTGKELVARAIYQHSGRAGGPFQVVNCAAIPETLLESELFGHEKGAFTGAERTRIGKFEQASGGVFFLDEIGDMTPLTQAKVLRFLQDRNFQRLGGDQTIHSDVRVIAATNRDLTQMASAGEFRSDLYYRLSVFTIKLPPLRDRGDDIRLLTEHYVRRFSREMGKEVHDTVPEVHQLLRRYPWPGNVRELQSVVRQLLLCATGPVLVAEFLPPNVRGEAPATAPPAAPADWDRFLGERLAAGSQDLFSQWAALTERHLLARVLEHVAGNLSHAARILGINRRTLRIRLDELGIPRGPSDAGQD
jgi:two-component system nitrogen regulation response regulator GlnG